ncbi:MAG TPA: peptidylprolyl isomerase [Kribbella sp.]|uniref:peptidylprolyl isomerase n=1 Tax=Kribbella sp. TaxID=1871183 RepID=UPI002D77061E|nr:peptidylprolyl isomerase [Kribbella sp.]HET6293894.1 peptidylprolyl isomerase [Kribbella sp.]
MTRGRALLVVVAVTVAMMTAACGRSTDRGGAGQEQALVVGGQVVTPEELKTYADAHSIDLTTDVGLQSLVTGVVRFKVVQQQAQQRGLIGYVDYAGFLSDVQRKNSSNEQAIQDGKAVYGVSQYQPSTYLSYLESSLQHSLQQALVAEKRIAPSESDLRAFYDQRKEQYAKKVDTISLALVRPSAPVQTITIDDQNAYTYSKYRSALYEVAVRLKPGQTGPVVGDTEGGALLARCISRKSAGYKTFQQVREEITQRFTDEQFQRYLDSLTTAAEVVVSPRLRDLLP